ncbi:MAG: lysine exporter LysO family protein [Prolixibacteraceae bacterium]|nr:lysine exporter LysO family protein [Prolixibacteraceae bacterium]
MQHVLLLLIVGFVAGYILRKKSDFLRFTDKLTTGVVYLLLLLLGVSVGANDEIIGNFGNIGLQAIVISLASIAGSILICNLISHFIIKSELETKNENDEK